MTLRKRTILGSLAAALAVAVPALAAPDQSATLSASTPKFTWEGAPQISHGPPLYDHDSRVATPCKTPARPCDYVLLNVTELGKFSVKVEGEDGTGGTTDPDAYLYESDSSGTQGKELASSAASGPDTVTYKVAKPGYFLAVVDVYHGYNAGYKGTATFTPAVAPAPAPAPTPPPAAAPAQQTPDGTAKPRASKKAACKKKAKKIKKAAKRKKALKRCAKMK